MMLELKITHSNTVDFRYFRQKTVLDGPTIYTDNEKCLVIQVVHIDTIFTCTSASNLVTQESFQGFISHSEPAPNIYASL